MGSAIFKDKRHNNSYLNPPGLQLCSDPPEASGCFGVHDSVSRIMAIPAARQPHATLSAFVGKQGRGLGGGGSLIVPGAPGPPSTHKRNPASLKPS